MSMLRAMCGVQLTDRTGAKDLTLMWGMKERIDQLAMATVLSVEQGGW